MLSGEFERTVDYKGRLVLPSGLLSATPDADWTKVQVLKSPERQCLQVYDMGTWQSVLRQAYATLDDDEGRVFMHRILSEAHVSELDGMNRITVPTGLLSHAGVDKRVIIVGMFQRLELWSPELWEAYLEELGEVELPTISDLTRARMREVS